MRTINSIILHHSASSINTSVEQIENWHTKRRFTKYIDENGNEKHIGYHFLILKNGEIFKARPVEMMGCHCKGQNKNSIGICITGNFTKDKISQDRYASLITLLFALFLTFGEKEVKGHKDYKNTLCPGINLYSLVPDAVLRANWHIKHNTKICLGTPIANEK